MTPEVQRIVRQLRHGDPAGFDSLYATYGDRIYQFCLRLCGRRADAEDLTQEVFLAAFQGQERFEGRSAMSTWLYRIAVYRWRRLFPCRNRQQVSLDTEMQEAAGAVDPTQANIDRMDLGLALASLSEDQRTAFVLVKVEGLTYREAAEVLQIPQGTIQSRVHDAARLLRRQLKPQDDFAAGSPPQPSAEPPIPWKGEARPCDVRK